MKDDGFKDKVISATKWSSLTEILAKLVTPITNMVLARILVPEAFGVVSTITMIISFTDIFTDAGVQKFLIQNEFKDKKELSDYATVAFWTNFTISCLLWGVIIFYAEDIAILVGNPGLGKVISVSAIQLPITSFSGIQMSLFRRHFEFNKIFKVRITEVFIPFFITIPLAFLGWNYWALILGTIISRLTSAVILTSISPWKPRFYFDVKLLQRMFNFSSWSLVEAFAVWMTIWIDTLIVGKFLSNYYLGIYKTSTTMVNALFGVITSATVPIVLATLSRLQNDNKLFKKSYLMMQKYISYLVIPLGVGIFLYSDLATSLFLGSQWEEAGIVIGMWAISSSFVIVLGQYCGDVYRSKGLPKLAFFSQFLHLIFLVPIVFWSAQGSFQTLVYVRTLSRIQFIVVHLAIMHKYMGIKVLSTLSNIRPATVSSLFMASLAVLLQKINKGVVWDLFSIAICILLYFTFLGLIYKDSRRDFKKIIMMIFKKKSITPHVIKGKENNEII